jgi:hypothetical protein
MLLDDLDHPRIEIAQGHPGVGAGHAQVHISEELLPIGISPPFLPELLFNGFNFLFREHQRPDPLHSPFPASLLSVIRFQLGLRNVPIITVAFAAQLSQVRIF